MQLVIKVLGKDWKVGSARLNFNTDTYDANLHICETFHAFQLSYCTCRGWAQGSRSESHASALWSAPCGPTRIELCCVPSAWSHWQPSQGRRTSQLLSTARPQPAGGDCQAASIITLSLSSLAAWSELSTNFNGNLWSHWVFSFLLPVCVFDNCSFAEALLGVVWCFPHYIPSTLMACFCKSSGTADEFTSW